MLKEGLYEDPERRDALFKLGRFTTTTHPAGDRTLADYVAGFRENQTAIYYLTGEDAKRLAASPQLEGFRARDVEVLLLADPVDAFWVSSAVRFDGKPFKSVSQGAADIKTIALKEGAAAVVAATPEVATLIAFFKQTLESEIAEARASDRLTDSLACLVAPDFAPDRQLEKILAAHGRLGERAKAVLEVSPATRWSKRWRRHSPPGRTRRWSRTPLADLRRGAARRWRRVERRPSVCRSVAAGARKGLGLAGGYSAVPGGSGRSGSRNLTPIESIRLHMRRTRRAVAAPAALAIRSSNSSGRRNRSSPVSLAPVAETLRTRAE